MAKGNRKKADKIIKPTRAVKSVQRVIELETKTTLRLSVAESEMLIKMSHGYKESIKYRVSERLKDAGLVVDVKTANVPSLVSKHQSAERIAWERLKALTSTSSLPTPRRIGKMRNRLNQIESARSALKTVFWVITPRGRELVKETRVTLSGRT